MAVTQDKTRFGRIGVLMGGPSTERDVSLKSGKAVYDSLKLLHLDVVPIDITTEDEAENMKLIRFHKIDCAFLALHGHFGEDGMVQQILDSLGIPYTGSGALSSKLAMDKVASRRILEVYGLPVPEYKVLERGTFIFNKKFVSSAKLPLVVKPAAHGSSIGLSIVDRITQLKGAIESAFKFDSRIIIEQYIPGRELTVGILDNLALPVVEIVTKNRFFDYDAKYHAGKTQYIVPADLEKGVSNSVKSTAVLVHKLLGCFGCSRVDFILGHNNTAYVLELNSIPGFTPTSLLPKAAKVAGIEFHELCIKLIELAYEKAKTDIAD